MSIKVEKDLQLNIIKITCEGVIKKEHIDEILEQLYSKECDCLLTLLDIHKVKCFDITIDAAMHISDLIAEKHKDSKAKLAVIAYDVFESKPFMHFIKTMILKASVDFKLKLFKPNQDYKLWLME